MLVFIFLVLALLFVLYDCAWRKFSEHGKLISQIPGPPSYPIFGNLFSFNYPTERLWSEVRHFSNKYYPIFKIWGLSKATIIIRHPDDIKVIVTSKKNTHKSTIGYDVLRNTGNNGIFVSTDQLWHHRHKMLVQAFTTTCLEKYAEKFGRRAKNLADELHSQGESIVKNTTPMFLNTAFAAVCDAMDFEIDAMPVNKENFQKAVAGFHKIFVYSVGRPYVLNWMLKYVPLGRFMEKINQTLDDFKWKVTKERRLFHERTNYSYFNTELENSEMDTKKVKRALGVLDLLLLAEKEGAIDEIGVCEEFLTMITAGFETTGMTLCYLLILLAENKKAQDLARAEVCEVLGDYSGPITMEHLKKMDYFGRCLKESLRIFPTVPFFGRLIREEVELSKYRIPSGSEVMVSVFDVHRDPLFWPEPTKFDSDRFLPENIKNQHPFAYMPFSGGIRSCIGQKFALLEIKTMAAQILRDFYLEPVDLSNNFKFFMSITLKIDKLNLKFIRIDRP